MTDKLKEVNKADNSPRQLFVNVWGSRVSHLYVDELQYHVRASGIDLTGRVDGDNVALVTVDNTEENFSILREADATLGDLVSER